MTKRTIAFCCLVILSATIWSWAATSWQLQTKLSNTGGTLKVRNNPTQTVIGTTVFTNFTTSAPVPVAVAANPGYKISSLFRNGSSIAIGNYTSHYSTTFQKSGGSPQALVAGFSAQLVTVTGTAVGPGSIVPTSATVTAGSTVVLTASPSNGSTFVTGVTGGTVTDSTFGNPVTLPYGGSVKITVTNVTSSRNVTATFATMTADAGVNQVTAVNSLVTLKGSMTGGGTALWNEVSGPSVTLSDAGSLTPTFTPTVTGTYVFQLTERVNGVTVASATTQVSVVASLADLMRLQCMGCHGTEGALPAPYVFNGWSTSTHKSAGISCISCHTDGPMPTPVNSNAVDSITFSYKNTGTTDNYCLSTCHTPGQVHKTPGMACANCHGDYKNHNPNTTFVKAATACFTCHGAENTTHFYSKTSMAPTQCGYCHAPSGHNPLPSASVPRAHFNGYTSYKNPGYAAAYVTATTQCADCHQGGDPSAASDTALLNFRTDWAASKHGTSTGSAWVNSASHNWKASGTAGANAKLSAGIATDCQRCHTATGYLQFAQYTTFNPVAPTSARYSEPLTCNACHVSGDFSAPRSIGARTGYYNYSSALTGRLSVQNSYPDAGRSNICLGCHVGRESGDTIKAMAQATANQNYSSSFWQDLGFVNSHYLTAGGQVYGVTGYEYPNQKYANGGVDHSHLGTTSAQGPCVACHLPASSHTLNPAQAGYALCADCHTGAGTMTASLVAEKTDRFQAGLKALAAALTQKGFTPNLDANGVPQYPYFTNRNWGNSASGPGNLGAAFNYNLLAHDPGAYAHNPTYTKRLVRDSIDYLVNGSVDRSRDITPVIASLLSDSTQEANATAFVANAGNGSSACQVCHSDAIDPLTSHNIVADYSLSLHASRPNGAACASCHAPTDNVAHPHDPMLTATAQINVKCSGCHAPHPWPSVGMCTNCHNGHDPTPRLPAPHLANFTTAQYIATNVTCDKCHYASDDPAQPDLLTFHIYTANRQWAKSGKANPTSKAYVSYDFKTMGSTGSPVTSAGQDCVRCHTTTGYINFVNSGFTDVHAWGTSALAPGGDRKREMVSCPACHAPTPFYSYDRGDYDEFGNPTDPAFARRIVTPVTAYYNYSTQASRKNLKREFLPDLGVSNNCVACHSGTVAGSTIKLISPKVGGKSGSFWNSTPFIDPHGMGGAGLFFAKTGYTFPTTSTRNYIPTGFAHDSIDDPYYGGQGACVACHLYTDKQHLFSPISSAGNGVVSKIIAFDQVCSICHDGGVQPVDLNNPANLDAKKQGFISSLKALAAVLATKGIYYNPDLAPYFFNVSDSAQQGPANTYYTAWNALNGTGIYSGEVLMGVAFNLRLLWSDAGAYAHNDIYAKKLLYDSIDVAYDGIQDLDAGSAIGALATDSGSFTADDKTRALNYIGVRPQ